jgi:hypothetical protein
MSRCERQRVVLQAWCEAQHQASLPTVCCLTLPPSLPPPVPALQLSSKVFATRLVALPGLQGKMCAMLRDAGFGTAEVLESWNHPLNRWAGQGVGGRGAGRRAARLACQHVLATLPDAAGLIMRTAGITLPSREAHIFDEPHPHMSHPRTRLMRRVGTHPDAS